jgi:hypothetical protein
MFLLPGAYRCYAESSSSPGRSVDADTLVHKPSEEAKSGDTSRTAEETLAMAWELLADIPVGSLKRIKTENRRGKR